MNMQHYDNEPWVLPHTGNKPNDAHDDSVLYNRELSDAANWRRGVDSSEDMGAWEALQLRTADWLTEHPVCTALVAVAVVALAWLLSHLMPAPWWSRT